MTVSQIASTEEASDELQDPRIILLPCGLDRLVTSCGQGVLNQLPTSI